MNGMEAGLLNLDSVAASAAAALISAAWQGAVLAGLAWAGLRMFPRLSAGARSAVWLSVFALLVALQAAPLVGLSGSQAVAADSAIQPFFHIDPRWSLAIAALWLAMTAFRLAQLVAGLADLRRIAAAATEISVLESEAGRRVRVCASDAVSRPCAIGFLRPRVLIPAALLANLSEAELAQVVAHEMAHLGRGDDWTNLIQKLALAAFPLNPALGWVERRLCAERELACDDRVLAAGSGRKAYALCLARLAEFALAGRAGALVLGALGASRDQRPELVRRVERILSAPARAMSRRAALGATAGLLACAVFGAVELAQSPQVVSFAPVAVASTTVETHGMSAAPGSAPKIVKASFVVPPASKSELRASAISVKPAVISSEQRSSDATLQEKREGWGAHSVAGAEPEAKLAGLRMGPPPGNGKLMVLTGWSTEAEARVVFAEMRDAKVPPAAVVPAVYIVATPNGWLIVQI